MDAMSREALERLTTALHERIGAPCAHGEDVARVEPLRRQVRHAVIGMDAYLSAVEAGNGAAVELREQALDPVGGPGTDRVRGARAPHGRRQRLRRGPCRPA
ncbi:hypothetical protein ACFVSN_29700 [Kitasatospora sp. NPDC057904]|uniref:hypothetical protein n=1 Tax=unclassified Kitasatospora TaxID=2633591 RepID=UPI0036D79CDE